jgi:hypothetical protein
MWLEAPLVLTNLYEFNYLDLSFSGSNAGATTDITTLRRVGDMLHASAEKWIGTQLALYKVNRRCGGYVDGDGVGAVYNYVSF